jgi:hypothetical protein
MGAWLMLAGIEFLLLGWFTVHLIRFFAKPQIPLYVHGFVFVSWYLGFFGTMFLPIDIAEAWTTRYWVNATEAALAGGGNRSVADPWANVTRSATPSTSGTPLATHTGSGTPSATPSLSGSASWSGSVSLTPSVTPSAAASPSGTVTRSRTPSATHTRTRGMPSRTPSTTSTASDDKACELGCEARALGEGGGGGGGGGGLAALLRALWGDGGGARAAQDGAIGSPSPSPSAPNGTLASPSPPPPLNPFVAEFQEVVVRNGPLEGLWVAVYWATAVLTYVAVPLVQEYLAAGEFSPRGRFCASLQINLVFYAVLALLGFLALTYVVVVQGATIADLFPLLISLANTSGLLIIVLLMGYGAAEVPRELWRAANPRAELRRIYFNAPAEEGNLFDAKNELGDILRDIAALTGKVGAMAGDKAVVKEGEVGEKLRVLQAALPVVEAVAVEGRALLGKSYAATAAAREAADRRAAARAAVAPEEDADEKGAFGGFTGMFKSKDNKYRGVSIAKLAALHKRLKHQVGVVAKATHRWKSTVLKAMELEWVVTGAAPPVPVKKTTAEGKTYYIAERAGEDARGGAVGGGRDAFAPPRSLATAGFVAQLPAGVDPAKVDVMSEEAGAALLSLTCMPTRCGGFLHRGLWAFKIHFAPYANLALAALAEVFSVLILWSEATIWLNLTGLVKPNLSVFGQLLLWADERAYNADVDPTVPGTDHEYFTVLCVSFAPLAYMCLISMYAVFKLKVLGMDISGNRNTDGYSLLVNVRGGGQQQRLAPALRARLHSHAAHSHAPNTHTHTRTRTRARAHAQASLMNRLQFSLAFNYLNVLFHSNNKEEFPDTAFLHSVGAKMSLSVVDWFLPLLMVLLYGACKLQLFDRLMRKVRGRRRRRCRRSPRPRAYIHHAPPPTPPPHPRAQLGHEERGSPDEGNLDHEIAVKDGQRVVVRARGLLGIGAESEGGEEERERASEASRARVKLVFARMEARRRGEDPDAVGTLDEVALDVNGAARSPPPAASPLTAGAPGAAGDSGSGRLLSGSLSSFSSGPGKGGGGLAALAARARGGAPGAPAAAPGGGAGGADDPVDPSWNELLASDAQRGGARGSGVGGSGGARGGAAAPALPMEPPPTLAQLLRGTRKAQGNTSLAGAPGAKGGGGASGAAAGVGASL